MKLRNTNLSIPSEGVWLDGLLAHAPDVRGLAIIVRAGTPSRMQSNENVLRGVLQQAGFATLTLDLLTRHEAVRDPDAPFNVPRLARRLLGVAEWIAHQPALAPLAIGLIGSATTSAAAVRAAWKSPGRFSAIVCQGGRPDLAGTTPLRTLTTPIRIVVGSEDPESRIIEQAFDLIAAERDWQVVSGADAAFAEPEPLLAFARQTAEWFALKLPPPASAPTTPAGTFEAAAPGEPAAAPLTPGAR